MILNFFIIIILFFSLGKIFTKNLNFFESIVIGTYYCYFIILLFTLFEYKYVNIFFFIKVMAIFSLIYFFADNYQKIINFKLKKKIAIKKFIFYFFVLLIFIENLIDIKINYLEAGDSLAYWYNKSKFFIYNPGLEYFPKFDYPNFVSSIWSVSLFIFEEDYNISRIILPFLLFISILTVFNKVEKTYGSKYHFYNLLLFFIILIFFSTSKFAGIYRFSNSGYVDFALSAYLMIGVLYTYISFSENNFSKKDYLFGILSLAICSSIKNDGYVISFGAIVIVNFIFFINYLYKFKQNFYFIFFSNFIYLIVASFPILISLYIKSNLESVVESTISYIVFSNLLEFNELLFRSKLILTYLFRTTLQNIDVFFTLLIIFIYKFSYEILKKPIVQLIFLFGIFFVTYIFLLYIVTGFPFEWHLVTSFDRIYYHFMGIFCVLCLLLLNVDNQKNKKIL